MLAESNLKYFSHLLPLEQCHSFLSTRQYSLDEAKERFPDYRFIEMQQPHGNEIAVIEKNSRPSLNVDACITQDKKTMLVVRTADCLPIIMASNTGFVAAIHAGRKSTELKITQKVCKQLLQLTAFSNLFIWLGPCICKKCYEINSQTQQHYDLFQENLNQIKESFSSGPAYHIFNSSMCTFCEHKGIFYSHRMGDTKRFYSGIAWQ